MNTLKKLSMSVMLITIMLFISCKQAEEKKPDYPDNEIPVSTTSQEALDEFQEGLQIFDQGNSLKAKPHFEKALELDPNFVSAQMYRAFTSSSAAEWAENREKFLAMRDQANNSELVFMDMLLANMEGDNAKERMLVDSLIAMNPTSARAMDYLAGYYSGMDDTKQARTLWKKAHELDPDFIPVISELGQSYLFNSPKDFDKAQSYMQMAVEKAPSSSRAQIDLGDCYRAQNNLEKALDHYMKAAELDPSDDVAYSKAGHANTFMGNYEAARENFRQCREVSEYGLGGMNFEAYTYLYEGDHEKALAFLEAEAASIDGMDIPESAKNQGKMNCTFDCAMIAMHHNNSEHLNVLVAKMKPMSKQVSEEVGSEVTTAYQNANMHYWTAMASAVAGNYEEAAEEAEKIKVAMASVTDPNKLRPYHRVHAYVNLKTGNAEKVLEHASKLNPDNVYVKYWMAKAHQMAGNNEKAMALYKEILNNNFNGVGYALILNETKEMMASAE